MPNVTTSDAGTGADALVWNQGPGHCSAYSHEEQSPSDHSPSDSSQTASFDSLVENDDEWDGEIIGEELGEYLVACAPTYITKENASKEMIMMWGKKKVAMGLQEGKTGSGAKTRVTVA